MPHYFKNKKKKYSIDENYVVNASDEVLNISLEELKLHPKTYEILKNNNILNIKAMSIRSERDYFRIQGFNKKSLMDIERALKNYDLSIRPSQEDDSEIEINGSNQQNEKINKPNVNNFDKNSENKAPADNAGKSFKDILNLSLQLNSNKENNKNKQNSFDKQDENSKNVQNKFNSQKNNKSDTNNLLNKDNAKNNIKFKENKEQINIKEEKSRTPNLITKDLNKEKQTGESRGAFSNREERANFNHRDLNRNVNKSDNRSNDRNSERNNDNRNAGFSHRENSRRDDNKNLNRNKSQADTPKNENELKKFLINGKYGYKNYNNQVVIPAIYDEIFAFKEDLACVEVKELYGYIDMSNSVVIPYDKFELAMSFSEGLAAVMYKGKYGYINKNGDFIIEPQFDAATAFEEGSAKVKLDGKWCTLSKDGSIKQFKS